jgi:outer membrane immunogenic protein
MNKFRFSAAVVALLAAGGVATAADLPSRSMAPVAPVVYAPPVFTWTGFYVGVNAGYGFGNIKTQGFANPYGDPDGFVGGGQVGYNQQVGQFVFGLEGDIQYADLKAGASTIGAGLASNAKIDFFGTVRGRVGVAFDRVLVYATGGYAYANSEVEVTPLGAAALGIPGSFSIGNSHNGWTLGGGVEYAINNNLTVRGEYLYVDLEKKNLTPVVKAGADFSVVRAALNYKF